jgi:hypothetical protein
LFRGSIRDKFRNICPFLGTKLTDCVRQEIIFHLRPCASVDESGVSRIGHSSALHLHKKTEDFWSDMASINARDRPGARVRMTVHQVLQKFLSVLYGTQKPAVAMEELAAFPD